MIMINKKAFLDESMWERFESKLKTWTYTLMHELLQSQVCSPFLYKLLLLIEVLQLIYYSVHPRLKFLWTTVFIDYFREIIQYFQISYILDQGDDKVFLVILYFVFSIKVIMLILTVITAYKTIKSQRKSSTFLTYGIKLLSTYGLLLNTITTIPFFNIFISTLYCKDGDLIHQNILCYDGMYFLHMVIAIFGSIFLIFFAILFTILYIDLNPNSTIPFAAPQSKTNLIRLVIKFFLPLYVTVDYGGNLIKEFIAIITIIYLFMLIQRYRTPPFYIRNIYTFQIVCDVTVFWVSLCGVIHAFLDLDATVGNIGLFFMVLGIPFVSLAYIMLLNKRNWNYMKMNTKNFRKDTDVEMYINIMIYLIENRDRPEERIKLEGLLKYHNRSCGKTDSSCFCQQLLSADANKEEDASQQHKKWYQFLKSILNEGLEKYNKSARLHLLHSHIQHEKLKNKFKALFELMITEDSKPNIQEEFSIYRYKNQIEEEMIENDMRSTENKGVDVNIIVHFQNKFVDFQNAIRESVNLHLEFWRELLEENPDIQKLQNLGSKITNTVESTNDLFKRLTEINPNHIKCLDIYGNFLKEIVNDDIEGQRILEKADYVSKSAQVNKQFIDNERLKYGENSNTCIITVSGNLNTIGTVTNSNNEITRILGYSKNDIQEQNISRIMPKVYADLHDGFMRNYLETSEPKVIGIERLVLCQNKAGYLVPCTLMIKVLPNLDEGIQIVGFLKDIDNSQNSNMLKSQFESDEKVHYLIYRADNEIIQGITNSCYQSFGIPASLVYGNSSNTSEFTIDQIAPDIIDQKNLEDLKSPTGLIVTLDTTLIQQNFLLDEEESEEEQSQMQDGMAVEENNPDATGVNATNLNATKQQVEALTGGLKNEQQIQSMNQSMAGQQGQNLLQPQGSNQEAANAEGMETSKVRQQKYKKTKIRVNLIEEAEYGEVKVHVIKFVEVDENEDNVNKMKSSNQEALEKAQADQAKQEEQQKMDEQAEKDKEKENQEKQQQEDEIQKSERDSQVSNNSVNDDMRHLKDFKALISEKTVPKNIKILKRTVIFLLIIIIVLTGIELSYKIKQKTDIEEGVSAINNAYLRPNIMVDVNYYSSKIHMSQKY